MDNKILEIIFSRNNIVYMDFKSIYGLSNL